MAKLQLLPNLMWEIEGNEGKYFGYSMLLMMSGKVTCVTLLRGEREVSLSINLW